jgi:hypothetical protein
MPLGLLPVMTAVLAAAAAALAAAAWRRAALLGVTIVVSVTALFLLVAGRGLEGFARGRSATVIETALREHARPDDLVVHEGAVENSASILLGLGRPIPLVEGMQSNLAFGATFPEATPLIWDRARLVEAWNSRRVFLVSVTPPERSVTRDLAPLHLIVARSGRRLYTNWVGR